MPKLATLNSHKANMTIGETRYYRIQTQNVVGSINTNTLVTEQWNSVQANLSIDITPVVSGNEQVTLDIAIQVADFIGDPPANAPPPSTSRNFTSLVRVLDGEMILLGGMERTSKTESGSGFPILSRIPIIKWFFSSKSKSKSKSISFVFIKPTIVY
jgi:type IV pilus assembly protein PilQ